MEQARKRQKMMPKKIGTHSGAFHVDEALACFLLHQTEEFKDAEIIRSRDPAVLGPLDMFVRIDVKIFTPFSLVDVGAIYDPSKHRYDHHQHGFFETFDDKHKIKLSSAGLVYKHFGRAVIEKIGGVTGPTAEIIYQRVYTNFVEALDGMDNGINQYETQLNPRFRMTTGLGSRVGRLNPEWNSPSTVNPDEQFKKAVALAGSEFVEAVNSLINIWLPARSIVEKAVEESSKNDGRIAVLSRSCPWKEHLFEIESEQGITERTQYVLFAAEEGGWRIQSVPLSPESFENRAPLPSAWRGKRDDELSKITGIDGCVFVHMGGFIGGNKTFDGALAMAKLALTLPKEPEKK